MNKLIIFLLATLFSVSVCAQDSTVMRKHRFSFLSEAELSPSQSFKGRGLSFSTVYNFSDEVSLGLGAKPFMMHYRERDTCYEYFTVKPDGRISWHKDTKRGSEFDPEFCLPFYVTIKCAFSKRTNASPFLEIRLGKDVLNATVDFYRTICIGARFGFKKHYSQAVNVSFGWQKNGCDEDFHDNQGTILFKAGYEF